MLNPTLQIPQILPFKLLNHIKGLKNVCSLSHWGNMKNKNCFDFFQTVIQNFSNCYTKVFKLLYSENLTKMYCLRLKYKIKVILDKFSFNL